MDGSSEEMFLQNLEEFVLDEDKIVTYKWLSKTLNIHVNQSKQLLFAFCSNKSRQESVTATYLLAGRLRSTGENHVTVIGEEKYLEVKSSFDSLTSEHVYSVQKVRKTPSQSILYTADSQTVDVKEDGITRLGAIRCKESVRRAAEELALLRINVPLPSSAPAVSKAKQPAPAPVKEPERVSPKKSPVKSDKIGKDAAGKDSKAKGGLAAMFAAQTSKASGKATAAPAKATKDSKQKRSRTKDKKEKDDPKKRKRIVVQESDSSDDDMFAGEEEEEEKAPSREPSPVPVLEAQALESDDDEIVPPTPTVESNNSNGRRRRKRKVTKDKTFMDDDGYVVTEKVTEYESYSESDTENTEAKKMKEPPVSSSNSNNKESTSSGKNKSEKAKAQTKKASPVKKSPMKNKQQSLMNFFKKKE
ncbi:hypothetical protein ONE63_000249 [Megalurothrips usitatus]|uniref:DNA polymerase delta subunit 3 n=1 Tax=Megalurothrips usitatus TaxID=439358 RepID=A0AAV7Y4P0_9NEOP|nr:hypothetical protein ONE63_000249 [Megalurothrips usitatus]